MYFYPLPEVYDSWWTVGFVVAIAVFAVVIIGRDLIFGTPSDDDTPGPNSGPNGAKGT